MYNVRTPKVKRQSPCIIFIQLNAVWSHAMCHITDLNGFALVLLWLQYKISQFQTMPMRSV